MTTSLFARDRAAFVQLRCSLCWRTGPASALDALAVLLDLALVMGVTGFSLLSVTCLHRFGAVCGGWFLPKVSSRR
ncbi:hypothetical protein [Streptomyces sp. NPDC058667]|uniref:hypothetical protein n=1 Tax=Streptomyces sp. NPDC058667 TaxID=3346588 RepID=UPI00365EECF9